MIPIIDPSQEMASVPGVPAHCCCYGQQEKHTNCGTKAADVLAKFWAGNFNANPLNILVHLQFYDFTTPTNSKCCSMCYFLAVIWRGNFGGLQICGVWGVKGRELRQSKGRQRLPDTAQYKVLLYLQPFGRNYFNVKLWPPNSTPYSGGGVKVDLGGRK